MRICLDAPPDVISIFICATNSQLGEGRLKLLTAVCPGIFQNFLAVLPREVGRACLDIELCSQQQVGGLTIMRGELFDSVAGARGVAGKQRDRGVIA